MPERVLVVVDEAYHEYVDDPAYPDAIADHADRPNVCVLRTFSKMYGLAGLRVGYARRARAVVAELGKVAAAFDVNELAQVAAVASLDDDAELERRRGANESRAPAARGRAGARSGCASPGRRQLRLRRGRATAPPWPPGSSARA